MASAFLKVWTCIETRLFTLARCLLWCHVQPMEYPLQFGTQTWKPRRNGELTVFLPTHPQFGTAFQADFAFVPPWMEDEDYASEHRTMRVWVHGYFPGLRRWDDLEGWVVEERDAVEVEGETVIPEMREPEIEIWSSGHGPGSIHTHARDGWETRMKFVECVEEGSPWVFLCEMEAFFPSERAREACSELWFQEFIGELGFGDREKDEFLKEGWRFRYRGLLELGSLSCIAPRNAADPIGYAKRMAKRELGLRQFGFCRVNGGDFDGSFKPEHGLCGNGRLVQLSPPSDYFFEWQERQRKKKGE